MIPAITIGQTTIVEWLETNEDIAENITYLSIDTSSFSNTILIPFSEWDTQLKQNLELKFSSISAGNLPYFQNELPNLNEDENFSPNRTIWSFDQVMDVYLSFVANSIWNEINNTFAWSILDYDKNSLNTLLSFENYFGSAFYWSFGPDVLSDPEKKYYLKVLSTPSSPQYIYEQFISKQNIQTLTQKETFGNILEFARDSIVHYIGGANEQNMLNNWGYVGSPPMNKMIETFYNPSQNREWRFAAGCHGMVG